MMFKKLFGIAIGMGFCMWLGGLYGFGYTINHLQVNTKVKTDAIVVLTGGRNRISKAVDLLNAGMAEKLFISGVSKGTSLDTLRKRKDVNIISSKSITLDEKAKNTVENAVMATEWIQKNKITSVRLVTSNYHIPRSMAEFRSYNKDLMILAHPVYSEKVEKKWWTSWRSFCLIASEFNKFLYVWVKTHIGR